MKLRSSKIKSQHQTNEFETSNVFVSLKPVDATNGKARKQVIKILFQYTARNFKDSGNDKSKVGKNITMRDNNKSLLDLEKAKDLLHTSTVIIFSKFS